MSISPLLCADAARGAWDGYPWAATTNAHEWYALRSAYNPVGQIWTGICERCDIVAAMVDTNYSRPQIVETNLCDAGTVTTVSPEAIRLTGFPTQDPLFGDDWTYDGDYVAAGAQWHLVWTHPVYGVWTNRLVDETTHWELQSIAGYEDFHSATLTGSAWSNVFGEAVSGAASVHVGPVTNVLMATTNIVTTNAFGAFTYAYSDDTGAHTGTGHTYMTTAFLGALDAAIFDLVEHFVRTNALEESTYTNLYYDQMCDWDYVAHGAGLTNNHTRAQTNTFYFTLQPDITNTWLLAEWLWMGSWERTAIGDTLPLRVTEHLTPIAEYHSSATGAVAMTLALSGDYAETATWAAPGVYELTNQWRSVSGTPSGAPLATGDYVTVRYEITPRVFSAMGGLVLSAEYFDERAAALSQLVWTMATPSHYTNAYGEYYAAKWMAYGDASNTLSSVAEAPGDGTNWAQLVDAADAALTQSTEPYPTPASYWYFAPPAGVSNRVYALRAFGGLEYTRPETTGDLLPSSVEGTVLVLLKDPVLWGDSVLSTNGVWPNSAVGAFPWAAAWDIGSETNVLAGPVGHAPINDAFPQPPDDWVDALYYPNPGALVYYGWRVDEPSGDAVRTVLRWDVEGGLRYR